MGNQIMEIGRASGMGRNAQSASGGKGECVRSGIRGQSNPKFKVNITKKFGKKLKNLIFYFSIFPQKNRGYP
jgi:hypothetical protein